MIKSDFYKLMQFFKLLKIKTPSQWKDFQIGVYNYIILKSVRINLLHFKILQIKDWICICINRLNVLALPERAADDDDDTLPHVVVKQRAVLPINVSEISRPVAMETGFTVPYSSMMQIRKQVRASAFKCFIQNPPLPK